MNQAFSAAALCLALATITGCGAGSPSTPTPTAAVAPPHQGVVFPLSNGQGNVEIVTIATKAVGGRGRSSKVVAYFYKPDMSPLASAPSGVSIKLDSPAGVQTIVLKPQADQFASDPGDFSDNIVGELAATVDGQPVTAKLNVR